MPPTQQTGHVTASDPRAGASPGAQDAPHAPSTGTPARQQRHRGRSIGLGVAAALLIFVTVVLVLFVMFNTQTVEISLVFGDVQAPLVLALVIAAVLGGLVVAMAGLARRARHRER